MSTPLPLPPSSVPIFDPRTGQMDIQWRNYYQSLNDAYATAGAPGDAQYWVSTSSSELTNERNFGVLATGYVFNTAAAGVGVPSTLSAIPAADVAGSALTRTNDTNVTLTLGGTPATALLKAVSLTLGWLGQLGVVRGGTGADLSATGGTSQVLKQTTVGGAVTVGQLALGDISGMGTQASAYGVGTAYPFTTTAAAIDFGTTDPAITLTSAGTYLLFGQVHLAYNAATVAAETATIKIRRTNNTAADLSAVVVIDLPTATTATYSYGVVQIPPVVYTTALTTDAITLFGNVSVALGAGTIDATAIGTSLVAVRIAA